uniref:Glutathione synthetase n=1 Tax=Anabas testudineus TaxID=64144 RepID=A0A3Q1H359_ANATE
MATTEILEQLIKDPDKLKNLVDEVKDLAFLYGIVFRTHETPNSSEVVTYAPFTLFPSPFPKAAFLQALALQTHFNTLVNKISQDPDFLEEALAGTVQADDFTAKLFDIYRKVQQEGRTQSIVVGLNRSDYMVDQREDGTVSLKQIEINTISAGGFGVSDRLSVVHRHVLKSVGLLEESRSVPDNNRTPGMCAALAKAWELYGERRAVILFLVEDIELSKLSHRYIEKELWKRNIPVIRRKFDEVSRNGSLNADKRLFILLNVTQNSCRSRAVKCPDISTHLAGTKKVQQVLARPGVLEKFFPDQLQVVEQIRATFAGLYTLDLGPEGDKTLTMALTAPERFVLKPQREGGGNNIYGSEICQVLQGVKDSTARMAYILMDKINPTPVQNYLLSRGTPLKITNCLSELGVFGAYVRQGKEMVMNECVGHLLKTKSSEHSDGGIQAGVSFLDNPLLV